MKKNGMKEQDGRNPLEYLNSLWSEQTIFSYLVPMVTSVVLFVRGTLMLNAREKILQQRTMGDSYDREDFEDG